MSSHKGPVVRLDLIQSRRRLALKARQRGQGRLQLHSLSGHPNIGPTARKITPNESRASHDSDSGMRSGNGVHAPVDLNLIDAFPEAPTSSIEETPFLTILHWTGTPRDSPILHQSSHGNECCFICLDYVEDQPLVPCEFCPKVFHFDCHIPSIPYEQPLGQRWRCNAETTREMTEEELAECPDSDDNGELTLANMRHFTMACKLLMECFKIAEVPTMRWIFPQGYLNEYGKAPYNLNWIRERLSLGLPKPFGSLMELMLAFRHMFQQAFIYLKNHDADYLQFANAYFAKFLSLLGDYFPQHKHIFDDLEYENLSNKKTNSAQSIFPLHFYNPVGPDPVLLGRYEKLEEYCNLGIKEKGNRLRIIPHWEENFYEGGLTGDKVTAKFRSIVGSDYELRSCLKEMHSFCRQNAHLGKHPCYCRHLLNGYQMVPVYLLQIPNLGLGLFANKAIKKGEYIMDFQGEFRWSNDDDDDDDEDGGVYAAEITASGRKTGIELDSSKVAGLGRFLNHSCESNAVALSVLINGRVRVVILATVDIQPFQQLCLNYGSDYFKERKLVCFCGSPTCQIKPAKDDLERNNDRDAYLKFLKYHEEHGP